MLYEVITGADFVVNSKDPETSQKIISICNDKGADSVVDFSYNFV